MFRVPDKTEPQVQELGESKLSNAILHTQNTQAKFQGQYKDQALILDLFNGFTDQTITGTSISEVPHTDPDEEEALQNAIAMSLMSNGPLALNTGTKKEGVQDKGVSDVSDTDKGVQDKSAPWTLVCVQSLAGYVFSSTHQLLQVMPWASGESINVVALMEETMERLHIGEVGSNTGWMLISPAKECFYGKYSDVRDPNAVFRQMMRHIRTDDFKQINHTPAMYILKSSLSPVAITTIMQSQADTRFLQAKVDGKVTAQNLKQKPAHDTGSVIISQEDQAILIVIDPYRDRPLVTRDMLSQFALDMSDFQHCRQVIPSSARYVHKGEYGFMAHEGKSLKVFVYEDEHTYQNIHVLKDKQNIQIAHFRLWPDWSSGRYKRFRCIRPGLQHKTFVLLNQQDQRGQRDGRQHMNQNEVNGTTRYWIESEEQDLAERTIFLMSSHHLLPIEEASSFQKPIAPDTLDPDALLVDFI